MPAFRSTGTQNLPNLGVGPDSGGIGKVVPDVRPRRKPWCLDGEPSAAFSASGIQHFPPTLGFHSGTEAVSFFAFFDAGLEGAFHGR